jgi:hypothetical protein
MTQPLGSKTSSTKTDSTEMYAKHHPDFMREATDALDNVFAI